jgi:hypothetical protein
MNNGSIIHAVHDTRFGLVSIYVLLIYGTNLFVNSSHKFKGSLLTASSSFM